MHIFFDIQDKTYPFVFIYFQPIIDCHVCLYTFRTQWNPMFKDREPNLI